MFRKLDFIVGNLGEDSGNRMDPFVPAAGGSRRRGNGDGVRPLVDVGLLNLDAGLSQLTPKDVTFSRQAIPLKLQNTGMEVFHVLFALREGLQPLDAPPGLPLPACGGLPRSPVRITNVQRYGIGYVSLDDSCLWVMKKFGELRHIVISADTQESEGMTTNVLQRRRGYTESEVSVTSACPTCELLCRTDQDSEPTRKRFAKHVADSHVSAIPDWPRLSLEELRAKSGASLKGHYCPICRTEVQVRLTACTKKTRCKLERCSNRYVCCKSRLALLCGHGQEIEADYDYRQTGSRYLACLYKMHMDLEESLQPNARARAGAQAAQPPAERRQPVVELFGTRDNQLWK